MVRIRVEFNNQEMTIKEKYLETVVPKCDGVVMVVGGSGNSGGGGGGNSGRIGIVKEKNINTSTAIVEFLDGCSCSIEMDYVAEYKP